MVAKILSDPKVITGLAALAAFVWWQSTRTTATLLTAGGSRLASGTGTVYSDIKSSGSTAYRDLKSQGSDAKKAANKLGRYLRKRF